MSNMKHWTAMSRPPSSALKTINGGRLSGMTDINPQWRYEVMTEQFGPCGIGWVPNIRRTWTDVGPEADVMAFVEAEVRIKVDGDWSEPIVGVGGSALIAKERNGLRASDEAYKMAYTDALSVCMKMLGVAADIYGGKFDGSKYVDEPANTAPQPSGTHATDENMARQLVKSYKAKIDADPQVRDWIAAAMSDGYFTDVVNQLKQRYGGK